MSTEPPARDSDTQPIPRIGSDDRKRAAVALGVLAVVALLVVAVMSYLLGSSNSSSPTPQATIPGGPAVTVAPGASAPKHTSASPTKTRRTTSAPAGPVSCPTANRCALAADVGNVVQALSSFRVAHGLQAVTGSVTKAAQDCVLHSGDGSSCPSGYFWEPVGRSGAQVIAKIAAGGTGLGWLLNPKLTSVQVGWAYVPSTKSFECVVVSGA